MVFSGERMTRAEVMRLNPNHWAFIGDAVWSLFVKTHVMRTTDYPLNRMHRLCAGHSECSAQAAALERISPMLTEEEQSVVRRGRRQRTRNFHPHADKTQYSLATALEALVGFLYLTGQDERLELLMAAVLDGTQEEEADGCDNA